MEQIHALGRRKAAVARVYLVAGSGNIVINDRPLEDYFKEDGLRYIVNQPLALTQTEGQFDIKVTMVGGGIKGQAEAIRLGIARALCEVDKEAYRPALKAAGFLTRDPREVSIHLFYFLHSWVPNPRTSFGMGIPGSYWKVAHTAENPGD